MDDAELLRAGAAALGLALDAAQIGQFLTLRDLLLEWNTRINLTAITEPRAVLVRHFLDALACVIGCDPSERAAPLRVLDVGSGAGLPGLALAIALPQWQITSLEATGKKVRFQEAAIAALGLANASAVQGRAETIAHEAAYRGTFAVVTARALAALPTLLEWCQPFTQINGCVLAPKKGALGDKLAQGARAARTLGGDPPEALPLPPDLLALAPDLADGRVIIRVRQRHLSAPRYPRSGAASMKTPLGMAPIERAGG
jgi:16S rRNA (guanine527-N7)-methyltransferase